MDYATHTTTELAEAYRAAWDRLDELDAERKEIAGRMADIESAIRARMNADGKNNDGDGEKCGGLSITVRHKFRARYEPEKWNDIFAALAASGHSHLVKRQLVDSRVMDLVDSGVPLPDGLSVEPYTDLSIRRI